MISKKQKIILIVLGLVCISATALFCVSDFAFADRDLELDYPTAPADPDGEPVVTPSTTKTTLPEYIKYLFNFLIGIGGILAFTVFVFGGVAWAFSAGNPGIIGPAKKKMLNGMMGLALLLCSYLIIYTINPDLTILRLGMIWESNTGPEYTPSDIAAKMYQEIPIGLLIEDILAKNISCFQVASAKMTLIDCRTQEKLAPAIAKDEKFNSDAHYNYCYKYDDDGNKSELMEYHDRMDCIKELLKAIKIKSAELKEKSEELEIAVQKCECDNCDHGYCLRGCPNCPANCISHCHCCGSPREEWESCSGDPPYTLYTDPCPNRDKIDDLRNEIYQLINGKTQKIDGADVVNNLDYNPIVDSKFLYLKEARKRFNGMKQELNNDLSDLEQAEELVKFPSYVKRLNLAQYFEKKLLNKMDKQEFKNFSKPEYDSVSTYCKKFNCSDTDNKICNKYELNQDGVLCDLYNLDGAPSTFYHSLE